jgi:BolA protein
MGRKQRISNLLEARFSPEHLEIINESSMHSVPEDSETHFKVVIVSDFFKNLVKVKRHQSVYSCLQSELDSGLHALSLQIFSSDEWSSAPKINSSPDCRGGSRA